MPSLPLAAQAQVSPSAINLVVAKTDQREHEHEHATNPTTTPVTQGSGTSPFCTSAVPLAVVCNVPVVRLDTPTISDVLAAGLASALVGHVLFLKSQVPLPVVQLTKMVDKDKDCGNRRGAATKSRNSVQAAKNRTELLASFDTLASHLGTTFTALSTAFARRSVGGDGGNGRRAEDPVEGMGSGIGARAYLAILVGPSIGLAKSRVLFAVDGLEVKVWGEREDVGVDGGEEEDHEESDDEDEGEEEEENEENEQAEGEDELEESEGEATLPPSSPSPLSSPSLSPSLPPSPPPPPVLILAQSQPEPEPLAQAKPPRPPYVSHARQQQTLFNAERLLSRTLMLTDADGRGLASDMGPTQTHILIRAPRRFSHPAWIPRQNVMGVMESALGAFLDESGEMSGVRGIGGGKKKETRRVEGVWVVGCESGVGTRRASEEDDSVEGEATRDDGGKSSSREEEIAGAANEEDEMIWWSWEGKLVGFSDW